MCTEEFVVYVWEAGGKGDTQRLGFAQPSIMAADYFLLSIKDRLISGFPWKVIVQLMWNLPSVLSA